MNVNNSIVFGEIHNLILPNADINIVVTGDYYCNDETEYTIENIISVNPELIITTEDHDKDVKYIKCWSKITFHIKDKMKIVIGNHDAKFF